MATLDSSIVNIALPTLTRELGSDLSRIKWVVILYLVVITWLLLPFGRLSDLYGRKRIFQLGYCIFTLGSALCGVSSNLGWLLISRVAQGIGAAMLMANGPALITATFPSNERGKALGTMAMVVSAGLVSGPSIGGVLIAELGWRSIFLVNIPVGFLGYILVEKFVPHDRSPKTTRFDWAGSFLQVILLTCIMFLVDPPHISVSGSSPMEVPRIFVAILLAVAAALFFKVETESPAPLFDFALLKIRTFWTANLASFFTFVAYSSVSVLMPFFLQDILHMPPDRAGLFMTAIPLTILIIAPISGRLSDRMGSRGLSSLGAFVGAVGLFVMADAFGFGLSTESSGTTILLGLCMIGLATGLFQSPNNSAIMSAVPISKLGIASALLATVRNLGLVFGTGLATQVFAWRQEVTMDFVESLHFTFGVAGVFAIGAVIAALAKKSRSTASHGTG